MDTTYIFDYPTIISKKLDGNITSVALGLKRLFIEETRGSARDRSGKSGVADLPSGSSLSCSKAVGGY